MSFEEIIWIAGACLGIVIVCGLIWTFYNKSKYSYIKIEESIKLDRHNKIVLLKYDDMDLLLLVGKQNLLLHKSQLDGNKVDKKQDPLSKLSFVYQDS